MDDLSKLAGQQAGTTGAPAVDPSALAGLAGLQGAIQQEGGLDGLMAKLREGGLGSQVDSWVGTGPNQSVEPAQIQQALGPDTVQRLSSGSGLDVGRLLPLLATFLPQIVNMLTPNGQAPGGLNQAAANADIGGLLGGLLGGSGGAGGAGGLEEILGGLAGMMGGNKG
jgi:uncharacterized protein YidB (DUF937 family)